MPGRLFSFLLTAAVVLRLTEGEKESGGSGQKHQCWHGDYDEHRCCVEKDPDCWDAVFTEKRCCPLWSNTSTLGKTRGDPTCWVGGFKFEDCCLEDPKEECWDNEFRPERCCVDRDVPLTGFFAGEDPLEAFARRIAEISTFPLGCEEERLGEVWRMIKESATSINVSRIYGSPGEKPSGENADVLNKLVLKWVNDERAWQWGRSACPMAALAAIDMTVVGIDRRFGAEKARATYQLRLDLAPTLPSTQVEAAEKIGWVDLGDANEFIPRVLGMHGEHGCFGSKLKIFIYNVPELAHMVRPVLACAQKMPQCAVSVQIHRWLATSTCVTEDAQEADLFYVPAYEACYNETACVEDGRCFPKEFDPVKHLPYFERYRGADHIFVFGCNFLPFEDPLMTAIRQSIFITVESFQAVSLSGPNLFAWFSHWKDVLIPGNIPAYKIKAMLAHNTPMYKRRLLVAFHGHSSRNKKIGHMYKSSPLAEVRDRIINYFFNASRCSAGPPVSDYFLRMGTSRFCLIPAGLTAWTIHLYESFFFGCVPVIMSDEVILPFQEEIDWSSLSLQVPASIDMEELHKKLDAYRMGRLKAMSRRLTEARCWFDYSLGWGQEASARKGCSPFLGMMKVLEKRAELARHSPYSRLKRFWEPIPHTD